MPTPKVVPVAVEQNETSGTGSGATTTMENGLRSLGPVNVADAIVDKVEEKCPEEAIGTPVTVRPAARKRSDSVTTFQAGGAESIFRLLPRETRPALRRMLFVEPSARCTLTDLLKGKGKTSGLLCGCHAVSGNSGVNTPPGGHCVDHDCDPEEEDDGDEWLKSIQPCSLPDHTPSHVHIKVAVEEGKHKRRFF
jgi:hypothetical protein